MGTCGSSGKIISPFHHHYQPCGELRYPIHHAANKVLRKEAAEQISASESSTSEGSYPPTEAFRSQAKAGD
jgi:hypothetical protein